MAEHLYQIITRQLRQAILDGQYTEGSSLPSENELAARYDTTRVTIRRCLQILEHEHLIEPRQGKGYFILPPAYRQYSFRLSEAENDVMRLRQVTIRPAPEEVARRLALPESSMVVFTRRLFLRDGVPVSFDEKFIPYERGMPTIELELNYAEFPELFAGRYVPMTIRTRMELQVAEAPEEVCADLNCPNGSHLLLLCRTVLQGSNQPIGFGRQYLAPAYGPITALSGYSIEDRAAQPGSARFSQL